MFLSNRINFKEFSNVICAQFDDHDKKIEKYCVKSSIVSLNDFYEGYKHEIKDINSEITPSKDHPCIGEFSDIFKAFDAYPANLKLKKSAPKELNRMNTTIKAATSLDVSQRDSSNHSLNNSKLNTDIRQSASEVLQDYVKFTNKLNVLLQDLQKKQALSSDYSAKLKQIHIFAQQLEKLLPSNGIDVPALSREEEIKLENIVQDMEKLSFLHINQNMFYGSADNSMIRLDSLLEVLSYSVASINCFNNI